MSYGRGGYGRGGGYRGRGEGSWRGGNRPTFSRAPPPFYSSASNYESHSRNYFQGSGNERFSSRDRGEDSYRTYREESQDYSNREFGLRSPEPPRKRIRGDSFTGGHSRRSQERSFNSGGNDYQSRSFYFSDKGSGGGYPGDKGSYREMRESQSGEFSFRKPGLSRSPRGSFRGRAFSRGRLRGRNFNRIGISSRALLIRRRTETYLRKRFVPSKSQDFLRRLKLYRLKRGKSKKSDEEEIEEGDEIEGKEEKRSEVEELSSQDEQEEKEEEEDEVEITEKLEDGGEEEKEEEKDDSSNKASSPKGDKKKESKKITKKISKKQFKKIKVAEGESNSGGEKSGSEDEPKLTNFLGQPFIHLKCPHCGYICVTFQEYSRHLGMKKHQTAMRIVSTKIHRTLAKMRVEQRQKQRSLDELSEGNKNLRTFFCTICKLNYRTLKSQHENTVAHQKMKNFLHPFCEICRMSFRTPMIYEAHICELAHIKRKAKRPKNRESKEEDKGGSDSGNELDADGFMVLDAVGSGDESEGGKSDKEGNAEQTEDEKKKESDKEKKKTKKTETKLGVEYCKVVKSYYCELCKIFLPQSEDTKKAVTMHCRSRIHLQRWMREVKFQRRKLALMKAKKELKDKENKDEDTSVNNIKDKDVEIHHEEISDKERDDLEEEEGNQESSSKDNGGEKIWSEMDQDLTELLNKNDEAIKTSEDEDDDSRKCNARYDKFKLDKSLEKSDIQNDEDVVTQSEEAGVKKESVTDAQTNGNISHSEKINVEVEV